MKQAGVVLDSDATIDVIEGEVADSSIRCDRKRQLPPFTRFGIPEVWLAHHHPRTPSGTT